MASAECRSVTCMLEMLQELLSTNVKILLQFYGIPKNNVINTKNYNPLTNNLK